MILHVLSDCHRMWRLRHVSCLRVMLFRLILGRPMIGYSRTFGIGLISDTSQNINSNLKGTLGKLSYFISTLQTISNTEPFHYRMEADGKTMEGEAVMIYAANGRFLGTNSLPFAPDALQDGELDILIIHETGIPLLREILSHKPEGEWQPQNESISYFKASTLLLETDAPMPVDTDGELYMKTPAELSVLAGHLTFDRRCVLSTSPVLYINCLAAQGLSSDLGHAVHGIHAPTYS